MSSLSLLLMSLWVVAAPTSSLSEDQSADLLSMSLTDLLNIEIEVETASKSAEKLSDAPGIISVVTAEDIQQYGANNLAEVLNRVTSINMLSTYFSPNNFTSIRGDSQSNYDNHVLLLLNGRPMRDSQYGSFNAGIYQAFPVQSIERLEIIRGPGSSLYGAGAYSGVINIITKRKDPGTSLSVMGGSFDTYQGELSHHSNIKGVKLSLFTTAKDREGWDFQAVDETGAPREVQFGEDNLSLLTTVSYKDLTFTGMSTRSEYDYWGGSPQSDGAYRNLYRYFGNLNWKKGWDSWSLDSNLTYNKFEIKSLDDKSESLLLELTAIKDFSDRTSLTLGVLASQEEGELGNIIPEYDVTNYSAYAQFQHRFNDHLKLIAGGQFNKPDGRPSDFVPRLGAIYTINEKSGLKLLYGEAYRSPSAAETGFNLAPFLSGNPDLDPEKVKTAEAQFYYNGSRGNISATLYHLEQEGLIGRVLNADPSLGFVYQNTGTGEFQGVELEGKYVFSETFYSTFGLTYQENENENGVEDFTTLPNTMAKIGIGGRVGKSFTYGVFDSYFSSANESASATQSNPSADAYHLVTANLTAHLPSFAGLKGATVGLYVHNLLDEDIYQPEFVRRRINTIPTSPERSFYVKAGISF